MYYVDKFWKFDVENVIKCWPKMSWNVNHKFRIYEHSISNIYEHFDNIWSYLVAGSDGMWPNVIKMFINVGNWMSEMWSNVGPKCLGMWDISSVNVIKCWIYGRWRFRNVIKCCQNVDKCWKLDVGNVIKCWLKMSWNVRNRFGKCYQMLDLWWVEVPECYRMLSKCW